MNRLIYILLIVASGNLLACAGGRKSIHAQRKETVKETISGEWELNYISGEATMDALYPDRRPTLRFDLAARKVNGNNSCNSYFGPFKHDGSRISFPGPMGMTKMFCGGQGEQVYMNTLKTISAYSISPEGKTLTLIRGDIAVMRFIRK